MPPSLRLITDVRRDPESCAASLLALADWCNANPTGAAEQYVAFADATLQVVRGIRAQQQRTAVDGTAAPGSVIDDVAQLLTVLAAACKATHAMSKVTLTSISASQAQQGLRKEASIVAALLAMLPSPSVPQSAQRITRITAKAVLRSRGSVLATDAAAIATLTAWITPVLEDAAMEIEANGAMPVSTQDDVGIAMLFLDRLVRTEDEGGTTDTLRSSVPSRTLLEAASRWRDVDTIATSSKTGSASAALSSSAVHHTVVDELLARCHAAERGLVPPAPGSRSSAYDALSGGPLQRLPSYRQEETHDKALDDNTVLEQSQLATVAKPGETLTLQATTGVLRRARSHLEQVLSEASGGAANVIQRRMMLEDRLQHTYQRLREAEERVAAALDGGSGSTAVSTSGPTSGSSSSDRVALDAKLARLEETLRKTSVTTPRMSRSTGGYTPRRFQQQEPRLEEIPRAG